MPFIAQLIMRNVMGILSDQLKKRKLLEPTAACKIFQVTGATSCLHLRVLLDMNISPLFLYMTTITCKIEFIGNLVQAFSLLMLAFFMDCNKRTLAITLLILQGAAGACILPGAMTSCLSIAPSFTGTIISLALFSGKLGSTISPSVIAFLKKNGTSQKWMKIFVSSALLLISSAIFFLLFGSAEQQSWDYEKIAVLNQKTDDKVVGNDDEPRLDE
uniref:MFS domain-containing protein n=1 Tax=Elaeophora elaphi TaxID=1147741 RepID=A0A0R3RM25_9BILA